MREITWLLPSTPHLPSLSLHPYTHYIKEKIIFSKDFEHKTETRTSFAALPRQFKSMKRTFIKANEKKKKKNEEKSFKSEHIRIYVPVPTQYTHIQL